MTLDRNLRRLREDAGLSVVELARRTGVARATLTRLERGEGNPRLDTLYAIADSLGVGLADLIAAPAAAPSTVVRAGDGPAVEGEAVEGRLLSRRRQGGQSTEVYAIVVKAGRRQRSSGHPPGAREHLHVHSGSVRVGPASAPVELGAGDYADYAADAPHVYEHVAGTAAATLVIVVPAR